MHKVKSIVFIFLDSKSIQNTSNNLIFVLQSMILSQLCVNWMACTKQNRNYFCCIYIMEREREKCSIVAYVAPTTT